MIHANTVSGSYRTSPHINLARSEFDPIFLSYPGWVGVLTSSADTHYPLSEANAVADQAAVTLNYDDLIATSWAVVGRYPCSFEGVGSSPMVAGRIEDAKNARQLLDAFSDLKDNWDGYDGAAISSDAIRNANHLLDLIETASRKVPMPDISPTASGTISFEWEAQGTNVYIEIGNTRYSGFIKTERRDPILLQGLAQELNHQTVSAIYTAICAPLVLSAPITNMHPQAAPHELLAA